MLEKLNLSRSLPKDEYRQIMDKFEPRLAELQREIKDLGIPVVILFEGWDAAGKGTLINRLLLPLDPRGFKVHAINAPSEEERLRPFLWRFWVKTPVAGRIAIFDRSWYGRVLIERIDKLIGKKVWGRAYEEINSFENQLADSGAVIIKLFLHISKKEQKNRFKKLEKNPVTAWKVTKEDKHHHAQYEDYEQAIEEMLERTNTAVAPWTLIESHNRRFAVVKVFRTVVRKIERAVNDKKSGISDDQIVQIPSVPQVKTDSILDQVDLSLSLERAEYEKELKYYQQRMREIEHAIFLKRIPVVIAYEGWDAAGKGGNIRRLVRGLDPRGYEVIPIAAPTGEEKGHQFLWRFWKQFPKAGHIAIFDRTWYGRVLVERVEGFCSESDWRRAYSEINEMERQWTNFGTVLIKFWLQISKEEQLRRFEERQADPQKQWKITEEDWRNREKWDDYRNAVDDMLLQTSTIHSPWEIIESDSKLYARIKVLKTITKMVERQL